jgi:hypothetical protein
VRIKILKKIVRGKTNNNTDIDRITVFNVLLMRLSAIFAIIETNLSQTVASSSCEDAGPAPGANRVHFLHRDHLNYPEGLAINGTVVR